MDLEEFASELEKYDSADYAMSEEFVPTEEFQNQVVDYLLDSDYHNEESLGQRERAAKMLQFMGYRGVRTYCKLVLDVDRWPYLIGFNKRISESLLNDTWNRQNQSYDPGILRREFNSFSDEEKSNIEGYLREMATIFEGLTPNDIDSDGYHEKYDQGDEWDSKKEKWNRTYYRHENGDGIVENGDGIVEIGLRSLGEIDTSSARKFLVDYFNDESRNRLRTKYQIKVNPDGSNGCPDNGFSRHRFHALKALGNRVPYSQIRRTINQFLDDSLCNQNMRGGHLMRIRIAKFLSNYGNDPDGLLDRLLEDDDTYVKSETRRYKREMGEQVDIQSIVDDILLDTGIHRVSNMMQYLELEENPDVNLIRQCITELASRDDLGAFKEFLEGDGEFEGMEVPFKEVDQGVVDEWVQLLEARILVTEEDPDLVIIINPHEFEEENA